MTTTLKVFFTLIFALFAMLGLAATFELVPAVYGGLTAGGFCAYAWTDVKEMLKS